MLQGIRSQARRPACRIHGSAVGADRSASIRGRIPFAIPVCPFDCMSCGGHDGDLNLIRKTLNASATCALLGLAPLSIAHGADSFLDLDAETVTATRVDRPTASLAATTVIDRDEIERSQALSLPDVLRRVPGLSLANNGGPGKTANLYLRGTNSDHVIVLIDGVKVGAVSNGGAAYQDFPVELIERIEVVRGPRSSLYGSETIGGVIQIFTRKGDGSGVKPFFSAGYGTHDTATGSAGVNGTAAVLFVGLRAWSAQRDGART
jgi:vitamin B12 transporter